MAELSPAAQVVFDAYRLASDGHYRDSEWIQDNAGQVAAALRAAADQVVPEAETTPWGSTVQAAEPLLRVRRDLLAIAAELEGHDG